MRSRTLFFMAGALGIGATLWFFLHASPLRLTQAVTFHEKTYTLEVAATDESRALGLGGRASLCDTCGMLFLFEEPGKPGFWMKGMQFSLDIAWLLGDEVVFIERHIPFDAKTTYYPDAPADRVLEFRAGTLENLKVGERVVFSSFSE